MYQIWKIYLDLWGHDCKKWVWPTFGCKLGQSDPIVMQLKLDMSCHLLNVYTKFQIDISKHVEEKSGKPGRTDGRTDGQTDRRTDGHCHGIIRPFFKRAYKNYEWWMGAFKLSNRLRNCTQNFPGSISKRIVNKIHHVLIVVSLIIVKHFWNIVQYNKIIMSDVTEEQYRI